MTAVPKNIFFMFLDNIVKNDNNTYNATTKMKPADVKCDSYAEYSVDSNEKHPKFKVGYHARISKYKDVFAEGYTPNCSEEAFVIRKVKNTVA